MPQVTPSWGPGTGIVFGQVPKTGTSIVVDSMRRAYRLTRYPAHAPLSTIPAEIREGRLVFGTLRDPWSWYASLAAHIARRGGHFLGLGEIEPWEWGTVPTRDGVGLYTWCIRQVLTDGDRWLVDTLVATDKLGSVLPQLGIPPVALQRQDRRRYRASYDAALVEAVRASDGWVAELMGWEPWKAAKVAHLSNCYGLAIGRGDGGPEVAVRVDGRSVARVCERQEVPRNACRSAAPMG